MQVFVKSLTSKTLSFEVKPEQSISSLKESISSQEGIDSALMSLVYEGKNLENENTFAETEVEELSTLHLVLALDGGKKKKKRK